MRYCDYGDNMAAKEQNLANIKVPTRAERQLFDQNYRLAHRATNILHNKLHTHNFYELLLCRSNGINFLINDEIYALKKNTLLLFNDTDVHGMIADESLLFERYVLEFDPCYVAEFTKEVDLLEFFEQKKEQRTHVVYLTTEQSHLFLSSYNRLQNYEEEDFYGIALYRKIALVELLLQVNSFIHSSENETIVHKSQELANVESILAYINNNLTKDLSLSALSKHFFISISHLSTVFKNATGFTVNNYIINQRIILATKLLKQNMSVGQVAEESGFNNYAHFIRTFSKFEGISPKQYALRHQAQLKKYKDKK